MKTIIVDFQPLDDKYIQDLVSHLLAEHNFERIPRRKRRTENYTGFKVDLVNKTYQRVREAEYGFDPLYHLPEDFGSFYKVFNDSLRNNTFKNGEWIHITRGDYEYVARYDDEANMKGFYILDGYTWENDLIDIVALRDHDVSARKMKDKRIAKLLTGEAIKRGYNLKDTVVGECHEVPLTLSKDSDQFATIHMADFSYHPMEDILTYNSHPVYAQGVWIPIADPRSKFFKWDVEFMNVEAPQSIHFGHKGCKIGCKEFTLEFLTEMYKALGHLPADTTVCEVNTELENLFSNFYS